MNPLITLIEARQEELWKEVAPLVEKMKAKYPKELNMDGLEPALTQDIIDIAVATKIAILEAQCALLEGRKKDRNTMTGFVSTENVIYNSALTDIIASNRELLKTLQS